MHMFHRTLIGFVFITAGVSGVLAESRPEYSADQIKTISDTKSELSGHVLIKNGQTEIHSDKATIISDTHGTKIYVDGFVATAN